MATNIQGNCCKTQVWLRKGKKKKKKHPMLVANNHSPKKKPYKAGAASWMDCFLIPKAMVINLPTGSSGDIVSLRACGSEGEKQLQELSRDGEGTGGFSCIREQVNRQELAGGQKLL